MENALALAGAMSTAELGISLAEMIRQEKVHGICCTGANLEEDVFNLIAHNSYQRIPNYRDLTPSDEFLLYERDLNRITDTCIPENQAIRKLERALLESGLRRTAQVDASFRMSSYSRFCAREA